MKSADKLRLLGSTHAFLIVEAAFCQNFSTCLGPVEKVLEHARKVCDPRGAGPTCRPEAFRRVPYGGAKGLQFLQTLTHRNALHMILTAFFVEKQSTDRRQNACS